MNKKKNAFSYLYNWASAHRSGYFVSVFFAIISVVGGILPYFAISKIVALLFNQSRLISDYQPWLVLIAISFLVQSLFHNLSTTISHKMTFAVIAEIRQKMCDKLIKIPMGKMLSKNSGEFKNLIIEKVDSIEPTLAHMVPEMTSKLLVPIIIWIYIMILNWQIGLLSLISIPFGFASFMLMMVGYEKKYGRYVKANKDLNSVTVEYINGIEVIKSFNNSAKSYKKFVDTAFESAHSAIDWMKGNQFYFALGMTIMPATLLTVLPACIYYYMGGSLAIADFIAIIVLSIGMMPPFIGAMSFSDDIAKIGTIVTDIASVLEEDELDRPLEKVALDNYTIELNNVSFGYNEKNVLHNINVRFKEGEVSALVGPSGSGKSTISKLIVSMWDTEEGSITIGNKNLKDIPLNQINSMIAYVSQDNFLFNESIMENIRKGNLSASDDDVMSIAKDSGCHDFITNLSHGYNTMVGSSGGHLSGGERQRISIARAMLKNAPIIILDEATSYTDPENEAIIQIAVSKLVKGKTLIVVAHRLSTITDSDKIIVMHDGNIEGAGKHKELLSNCKLYNEMYMTHIGAKDSKEASHD